MANEYKLSYTATDINEKLSTIGSLAYKSEIPSKLSELTNDSGFATESYVDSAIENIDFPETDLSDYALKSEIPTNYLTEIPAEYVTESELNAKGYLTQHQSLAGLATETFVNEGLATKQPVGDYALKSDIPTDYLKAVPAEYVTEYELNSKGYLTSFTESDPTVPAWAKASTKPTYTASEVGALPADTVIPTVPTNVSAFTNDAGYLTEHQSLEGLATETYVTEAVATKADSDHTHDYNDLENKTHYIDKELNLDKSGQYTVTKQIYVAFGYPDVIVCTCDGVEYTLNKKWVGATVYWGYDEFQAGTSPVYFKSNATGDAQSINVVDDGKAHEVVYSTYYATNVYVPLDERFIPETIARASDVATKADAVHAHSWSEIKDNPFDDVVAKDLTLLESGECTVTKLENFLINSYCDTIVCTCDDVEYTFDDVFNDGRCYWGYDEFQAGTSPIYFWSNVTLDGGEIRVVDDGQPHAVTYSTYRVTEVYNPIDSKFIGNDIARVEDIPDITAPRDEFILNSSTEGSTKQFKITIDDTGTLTVSEIV